jgi:hypothetical protein
MDFGFGPEDFAPEASSARSELANAIAERDNLATVVERLTDQVETGSAAIMARLTQREAELKAANDRIDQLSAVLDAKSETVVSGHLEAIKSLRTKATGIDQDGRYEARARIAQAVGAIVSTMSFHPDKTVSVTVGGGAATFELDDKGQVSKYDYAGKATGRGAERIDELAPVISDLHTTLLWLEANGNTDLPRRLREIGYIHADARNLAERRQRKE